METTDEAAAESEPSPTEAATHSAAKAASTAHPAVEATSTAHSAVKTAAATTTAASTATTTATAAALSGHGQCQQATDEKEPREVSHNASPQSELTAARNRWQGRLGYGTTRSVNIIKMPPTEWPMVFFRLKHADRPVCVLGECRDCGLSGAHEVALDLGLFKSYIGLSTLVANQLLKIGRRHGCQSRTIRFWRDDE